jgi:CRP-like cAMP-binding protein
VDGIGLSSIPLLDACSIDELEAFAAQLQPRHLDGGETLMREGEAGQFFALVVTGQVAITRQGVAGVEPVATAGSGSILGELALLRHRPRGATVTATTPTQALTGDAAAFETLLHLTEVEERIRRTVSSRLAENAFAVHTTLANGVEILLRPLLPTDRARLTLALGRLSPESLRRRFFSPGAPSDRLIDYLIDIDYVDHYAWVLVDARQPQESIAVARYIRSVDSVDRAELGFDVIDPYQGRGIGTMLLGALGVAGLAAGVAQFTAEMLYENTPMRAVLAKADATFKFAEPGVVAAELDVAAAAGLVPPSLRTDLAMAVRDVVTAAGLALAHPEGQV